MELKPYRDGTALTDYIPIPRSVLQLALPPMALVIYGLLLDRATLSQKHRFTNGAGWIYVVYPQEELAAVLSVSTTAVKRHIRALENQGLLLRQRAGPRGANRLFLNLPAGSERATPTGTFCPPEGAESSPDRGQKVPVSNRTKQPDFSNYYQREEEESL